MRLNTHLIESSGMKTITVQARDRENQLVDLINYIGKNGNTGHSFSIIVDPDSEDEKKFYWDGDGSGYIKSVKVDNETK